MKRISTHVLDVSLGRPAGDVPVRLERRSASGVWQLVRSAQTDADGRCVQLLGEDDDLTAGVYRVAFDTASYFSAQKVEGLYPVVEVTFHVQEGEAEFHIPLLLSPNAYTTYRGS
jgi:5-hydroxyisourate hydrolase